MGLKEIASLSGHTDRVWHAAWSPSGSLLATCGGDKTVRIWGREGDKWVCKAILEEQHSRTIRAVAWSPNGKYLACASFDATSSVWQHNSAEGDWECIATLEGHENEVKCAAWDASGTLIATCSRDKSVWIWEALGGGEFECVSVLNGHTQDVKMVLWHPTEQLLASASYDDTIKIWMEDVDEDDWTCVDTLKGHTSTVWCVSFNSTGSHLVSCSDDLNLIIWKRYDANNRQGITVPPEKPFVWKNVCTVSGSHSRTVYSVDWNPNKNLIVTGAGDDCIRVFGPNTKGTDFADDNQPYLIELARAERAHSSDVNCVKWHPTQTSLLVSAGDDGLVKLWEYTPDE